MENMAGKKIKFRNYKHYPSNIMEACNFRDNYADLPDGAYFALADDFGLSKALNKMAEWEAQNTTALDIMDR